MHSNVHQYGAPNRCPENKPCDGSALPRSPDICLLLPQARCPFPTTPTFVSFHVRIIDDPRVSHFIDEDQRVFCRQTYPSDRLAREWQSVNELALTEDHRRGCHLLRECREGPFDRVVVGEPSQHCILYLDTCKVSGDTRER